MMKIRKIYIQCRSEKERGQPAYLSTYIFVYTLLDGLFDIPRIYTTDCLLKKYIYITTNDDHAHRASIK